MPGPRNLRVGSFISIALALVLIGCGGEDNESADDPGQEAQTTERASEQVDAPESNDAEPDADAADTDGSATNGSSGDEQASGSRDEQGAGLDDEAAIRKLDRQTRRMYRNGNAAGLCKLMTESEQSEFALLAGSCEEGMRYAIQEIGDASQFPAISEIEVSGDTATVTYDDGTVERMARGPRGWLRDGLVKQAE